MFYSCRIQVNQIDPTNSMRERWVIVKLQQAKMVTSLGTTGADPNEDAVWKWMKGQDAFEWWGRWHVGVNSVTGEVSTSYTVGSSAPQDQKFWAYSLSQLELNFIERWPMTSGEDSIRVPLTLYRAWITPNGIVPMVAGSGTLGARGRGLGPELAANGTGRVDPGMGSNILRPGYSVVWEGLGPGYE